MDNNTAIEFALSRLKMLKDFPDAEKKMLWNKYEQKLKEYELDEISETEIMRSIDEKDLYRATKD